MCAAIVVCAAAVVVHAAAPRADEPGGTRWRLFEIRDRTAISLLGPTGLRDDLAYVSFAGDLGFLSDQPLPDLADFVASDRALLEHFELNVINLEFLPGDDVERALVDTVLEGGGFDVVALANNHALDAGQKGLDAARAHLEERGHAVIGLPSRSVHAWQAGGRSVAIYSLSHYTDAPPAAGDEGVLIVEPDTLARLADATRSFDLRIAFIHLGSLSRFPSPHEMHLAEQVIGAGADLVVCSGAHFVKGLRMVDDVPVLFGTGNHLFSYKGSNTEPVGMHVVAGIGPNGVEQIFAIPFDGDWIDGPFGPLDHPATAALRDELKLRSDPDAGDYFTDDRTVGLFWESLRNLDAGKLKHLRPRHFAYAVRIVFAKYPVVAWSGAVLAAGMAFMLLGLIRRRRTGA